MNDGWETSELAEPTLSPGAAPAPVSQAAAASSPSDGAAPHLGQLLLGEYRLTRKLGAGGMGIVYLAEQTSIGRQAAVKLLRAELDDPATAKRFEREARAASRLGHPNIVEIYNFGRTPGGELFLAMELVEGRSLTQMLAAGAMSPRTVCELGAQLADALALAHKGGVVHRDLKPDNILVKTINDRLVPKIVDFGIAKAVAGSGRAETVLTADGRIFGTPSYMAPEQARGRKIDPRTDIYSLGVILYQMLTGRLPIRAATPVALVLAVATAAPDPIPPDIAATLPPGLGSLVERMLAKDPKERPATMLEVRDTLAAAASGAPLARLPAERRWFVPAAAVLLVTALAALAAAQWRLGLLPGLPTAAPRAAVVTEIDVGPRLVRASATERPAWLADLGPDSRDPQRWVFRVAARRQPDLERAKDELREAVAEAASLALAGRAHLGGYGEAVYLPALEAKARLDERLRELEARGDQAGVAQARADRQGIERFVFTMFEARFPGALTLDALYWEEREQQTLAGPERFVDAYASFALRPTPTDLSYYAETRALPAIGLVVTHFLPPLAWVHGPVNGAVVLEVQPASPAARADVRRGDVLTTVRGQPVDGLAGIDALAPLLRHGAAAGIELGLLRGGRVVTVSVAGR